jgi:hypothetical protein
MTETTSPNNMEAPALRVSHALLAAASEPSLNDETKIKEPKP